jgi:phosphohistidine phosphatase
VVFFGYLSVDSLVLSCCMMKCIRGIVNKEFGGTVVELLLVRHGQAGAAATDDARTLTERGQSQARTVGELLQTIHWAGTEVWHSPKARAKETAEKMLGASGLSLELKERSGLRPEDNVVECAADIETVKNDLIIVGHNPFMDAMGDYLTPGDVHKSTYFFSTGSSLHLKKNGAGDWETLGFYTP